ncbi:MAG: hypothetical protein J5625_04175 [Lachnospiraceae bacterium]|nr:hypothetical protein [Lachnospiraceae bacterium]
MKRKIKELNILFYIIIALLVLIIMLMCLYISSLLFFNFGFIDAIYFIVVIVSFALYILTSRYEKIIDNNAVEIIHYFLNNEILYSEKKVFRYALRRYDLNKNKNHLMMNERVELLYDILNVKVIDSKTKKEKIIFCDEIIDKEFDNLKLQINSLNKQGTNKEDILRYFDKWRNEENISKYQKKKSLVQKISFDDLCDIFYIIRTFFLVLMIVGLFEKYYTFRKEVLERPDLSIPSSTLLMVFVKNNIFDVAAFSLLFIDMIEKIKTTMFFRYRDKKEENVYFSSPKQIAFNLKTLDSPREFVENDVIFVTHAKLVNDSKKEDGFFNSIELFCHKDFEKEEGTYIDLSVKSYNTLEMVYRGSINNYRNYNAVVMSVNDIENDSLKMIMEIDPLVCNLSKKVEIDISNYNKIRLSFTDKSGGFCSFIVEEIQLFNN